MAERSKATDCKSVELCSTLVQIQLSLILRVINSMVEYFVYTERVSGSNPLLLKLNVIFQLFHLNLKFFVISYSMHFFIKKKYIIFFISFFLQHFCVHFNVNLHRKFYILLKFFVRRKFHN